MTNPSELRHDVRENFEQYIAGIDEVETPDKDDRPIAEQAAGMMDQLHLLEEMMGTNTFTDVIERRSIPTETPDDGETPDVWVEAQEATPPAFPSYRLD